MYKGFRGFGMEENYNTREKNMKFRNTKNQLIITEKNKNTTKKTYGYC